MSFRAKVITLGSILAALVAVLLVGTLASPRGAAERAGAALLFPALKKDRVQEVEISEADSRVRLARGAAWTIDVGGRALPAAADKVEGLLAQVATLARGSVVTRDAKAAEGLGLGQGQGKKIVLRGSAGAVLCEITVGGPAAGGGSYLRVGDRPEVLQTGEGLSPYLAAGRASWADLRVLPRGVGGEAVMRISVSGSVPKKGSKPAASTPYTLLKDKGSSGGLSWTFSPPGPAVDQQKASQLASALASLEGADLLTDQVPVSAVLASPAATVTVSLTDDRTFTILLGAGTDTQQHPCAVKETGFAYLVPEWRMEGILPSKESLAAR
jgi:hypothetical protein